MCVFVCAYCESPTLSPGLTQSCLRSPEMRTMPWGSPCAFRTWSARQYITGACST